MPVERISIHLKPSSFFEKSPAFDVPPSDQRDNQSRLHQQPHATTNGVNGNGVNGNGVNGHGANGSVNGCCSTGEANGVTTNGH